MSFDPYYMNDHTSQVDLEYRHRLSNRTMSDDWKNNDFPPLSNAAGESNRKRLDSNSSYSTDSSAGGTRKKRSHRPRGCRGGGSRRARKEKRAAAAAAAAAEALADPTTKNIQPGVQVLHLPTYLSSRTSSSNPLERPGVVYRETSDESETPYLMPTSSSTSSSGDWTSYGGRGTFYRDGPTFYSPPSFNILPTLPPGQLLTEDCHGAATGMDALPPRAWSGGQVRGTTPSCPYALVTHLTGSVGSTSYQNAAPEKTDTVEVKHSADIEPTQDAGSSLFVTSPRSFLMGSSRRAV